MLKIVGIKLCNIYLTHISIWYMSRSQWCHYVPTASTLKNSRITGSDSGNYEEPYGLGSNTKHSRLHGVMAQKMLTLH
jgi:hypothetical protein